ncbi:trypsin-7-like [Culicoides brevitarsis]|uniref:trypsin-7-like n=1 Tax=Culicoides brevitarsis TaxID=469753 RepID=UPI00307B20F6
MLIKTKFLFFVKFFIYQVICEGSEVNDDLSPFIYYGNRAALGQFPFMVLVVKPDASYCGGAVLTTKHVITAGNCIAHYESIDTTITLFFGQTNRAKNSDWIVRLSTHFIIHEEYSHEFSGPAEYDIAILVLHEPLTFSSTIQPVQLPSYNDRYYSSEMFTAVGWGITERRRESDDLLFVPLKGILREKCQKIIDEKIRIPFTLDKNSFCVIPPGKKSRGICPGDSGSPLVLNSTQILMGIASWSPGRCTEPPFVAGFTYVYNFVDWIKKKISETD